ncbi:MAG: ABC transporter substrate-binding protein [Clostridiales bacterium]|nr:ABC transporter substrate-binding protein [Clostridiales bacterium]
MKKILAIIVALATTMAFATACNEKTEVSDTTASEVETSDTEASEDTEATEPSTAESDMLDRAGNGIVLPEKVDRIVSMAPSTTQVLIEIGLADKIIGADTNSTASYDTQLPSLVAGFDMMSPDCELIASLEPDIVFTSGMSSVGGTSPFQSLIDSGICVADIPSSASIADIAEDIRFIGIVTGKESEAEDLVEAMTLYISAVEDIAKTVPEGETKTVLLMMNVPSAEYPTIYTVGTGTYMDEMFGIIGAKNAFGDQEGWLAISIEEALAADPDVILMDCNWMPGADEAVKALEGWENVKAVKNGDVYQIDEDLCSRPNHHVAEACAEWARCIYPDQFNEFNMTLELMAEAA